MPRLLALIYKEFLILLKDWRSRLVVIAPPLIQLFIFSYAATYDLTRIPYAVFDQDRSALSHEVLAHFRGSKQFVEVAYLSHDRDIAALIDRRRVLLVLHLGPDFEERIKHGQPAKLQVILDGRNSNTARIALRYVQAIIGQFNQNIGAQRAAPLVQTRAWFNENLQSRWFIVPGLTALLTLVVAMVTCALTVAREREQGTFDQLLVTPLTPLEILIGKTVPSFIIGLAEGTLILVAAVTWFGIPFRGSLGLFYFALALYLLSAIGVGLMISSIARTQQQGLFGAFMFLVPAVILSGFATPIENMPEPIQYLTRLNPMRYFLTLARQSFLADSSFAQLWPELWPMALIGAVTLTLAAWLFRHRLY
ncbi:MAG: ABC transporter permease [Methylohalobius sp.]|nr:ABC transporter permease [Methylohalobius sp.]